MSTLPHSRRIPELVLLLLLAGVAPAEAQPGRLREMTTDRPDVTESPYTVDVGHVQLEMHGVAFTRDVEAGTRTTEWEVAPFNLRLGLTPQCEAGVFVSPFVQREEKTGGGPAERRRGIGDTTLRFKLNFTGNDGGPVAIGVIADLSLPTGAAGIGTDKVEPTVIFPVAFELGHGWDGGMMTGVSRRHVGENRYRGVWINTITVGHDLAGKLAGFAELTSETGEAGHAATFDVGLTYRTGPNTQFDAGVNLGLSRAAPDLTVFVGLSRRF